MFVWFAVCAISAPIDPTWKWAMLCPSTGEATYCDEAKQMTDPAVIDYLKQSGMWDELSESERKLIEEVPKYFGTIVNANPSNIDKVLASITDGYMLSVFMDGTWPSTTPINFDKLSKHFLVTLELNPYIISGTKTLSDKRARMLSAFSHLGKIRDHAMKGKIDKKQLADLSSKVFAKAFGVKTASDLPAIEVPLTCDDDGALEKIDFLTVDRPNAIKMQKKCSVPAFSKSWEASGYWGFASDEDAKNLEASYCLLGPELAHHHFTSDDGYYNCKDLGFAMWLYSSTYDVVIKKDGWQVGEPTDPLNIKKSMLKGDISELLAFWDDWEFTEPITIRISVSPDVTTLIESKFNISVQAVSDITFDGALSRNMINMFPEMYESKLLANNAKEAPTVNVVFDPNSNWENVKFDLIVESKDPTKIQYDQPPTSVKVTTSGIDSRPTGTPDTGAGGNKTPEDPEGLSDGAIAGIVIGCVVVVAAIAAGVFFFLKKNSDADTAEP